MRSAGHVSGSVLQRGLLIQVKGQTGPNYPNQEPAIPVTKRLLWLDPFNPGLTISTVGSGHAGGTVTRFAVTVS